MGHKEGQRYQHDPSVAALVGEMACLGSNLTIPNFEESVALSIVSLKALVS